MSFTAGAPGQAAMAHPPYTTQLGYPCYIISTCVKSPCVTTGGSETPVIYVVNDQHACCPACQFFSPAARLCITVQARLAEVCAA